jgi:hypothetical protein
LAQAATQAVGARRRTVYAITPDGRAALEQVHVRAQLFDALWSLGLTLHLWAERSQAEVARWTDLELADNEERALRTIREALAHFPLALAAASTDLPPESSIARSTNAPRAPRRAPSTRRKLPGGSDVAPLTEPRQQGSDSS